jgi:cell wall-active antibiotic response 4TMS protein YvqF
MHIDRRLLGWGLFFILLGGIPLAVRANLIDRSVVAQWPNLWPLLLIAWGIGLLLRNTQVEWVGGALTAITFGVMGGGLIATGASNLSFATGCSGNPPMTAFQSRSGDLAATAQVNVSFNCGTLKMGTADGSTWNLTGSDRDARGPKVTSTPTLLTIESDDTIGFPGGIRSDWSITVPRTPTIGFGLTLNAGEGTIDLAGATLDSSSITLNAGKLDVDMGAVAAAGDVNGTVNAGAAAITLDGNARDVGLSLNAGSLQLCVPADAPLRVRWSGTLGSNNFSGAGLTKVDDSTWTTPNFDQLQPHTELHVSANAGSFELRPGGTCRA